MSVLKPFPTQLGFVNHTSNFTLQIPRLPFVALSEQLLRNVGHWCFYCIRVYEARYEVRGWKLSHLHSKLAEDSVLHKEWNLYLDVCIGIFKDAGTRDVRMKWGIIDEKVKQLTISEVEISGPETVYMPLADYIFEHGDPNSNGKGHSTVMWEGEWCVMIAKKRQWSVKNKTRHQIVHQRTRDDSKFQLSEDQASNTALQLSTRLFAGMPKASGVSLQDLIGSLPHDGPAQAPNCADNPPVPARPLGSPISKGTKDADNDDEDDDSLRSYFFYSFDVLHLHSLP